MSQKVLDEKMVNVKATRADIIASANAGCIMQLQAGCRRDGVTAQVRHIIDLLDEAYRLGDA